MELWERFGGRGEIEWVPGRWKARPSTQREDRRLVGRFDKDQGYERRHVDVAHEAVDIGVGTPCRTSRGGGSCHTKAEPLQGIDLT